MNYNYRQVQLDKVKQPSTNECNALKIVTDKGYTNYLNITEKELKAIIKILY